MKTDSVGNSRQRKNRREYWNEKNNQKMRKWQVVFLYVGISILLLVLLTGYTKAKMGWIQEDGGILAEELFSTMIEGDTLPWNSTEGEFLAVIQCDKNPPIFINENDSVGSEVSGCIIHLAKGTEIVFASKLFKTEGIIKFKR